MKCGQAEYKDNPTTTEDKLELVYKKDDGNETFDVKDAKKEYKHTLTTYLPYSEKYGDIIIEYTLDNYIRVYGKDIAGNVIEEKAGYLICAGSDTEIWQGDANNKSGLPEIKFRGNTIEPEILKEQVYEDTNKDGIPDELNVYNYIYDIQNEKYYWDADYEEAGKKGKFFRIVEGEKIYLSNAGVGEFSAKYRKVVIIPFSNAGVKIEVYQLLNGVGDTANWYIDKNNDKILDEQITASGGEINRDEYTDEYGRKNSTKISKQTIYDAVSDLKRWEDCSAINYYVDANEFTYYITKPNSIADIVGDALKISVTNDPEKETSAFAEERREVIKKNVQDTLTASISQYAKQPDEDEYEYKVIKISEPDWDQIQRNASIITFFEGVPIGLKYYNNYAISTSTINKEFVNKDEIYFCAEGDEYFHRAGCEKIESTTNVNQFRGYKNTDYIRKRFTYTKNNSEETKYYYFHEDNEDNITTQSAELKCYHCLVGTNSTSIEKILDPNKQKDWQKIYNEALARERYIQNRDVRYLNGDLKSDLTDQIKLIYDANVESPDIGYILNSNGSQISDSGGTAIIKDEYEDIKPYTGNSVEFTIDKKADISINSGTYTYTFKGWDRDKNNSTAEFEYNSTFNPDKISITENTTLYAIWEKTPTSLTPDKCTLTYKMNDGTNTTFKEEQNIPKDTEKDIISDQPTRTDYEFIGWATTNAGTTAEYSHNTSGLGGLSKIKMTEDKTLYAIWKKIEYKIPKDFKWRTNETNARKPKDVELFENKYTAFWPDNDHFNYTSQREEIWFEKNLKEVSTVWISDDGRNIEMLGNYQNPGKNAIWTEESEEDINTIKFQLNIEDFGRGDGNDYDGNDSFAAAGILLGTEETVDFAGEGVLTGYAISIVVNEKMNKEYEDDLKTAGYCPWGDKNGQLKIDRLIYDMKNSTFFKRKEHFIMDVGMVFNGYVNALGTDMIWVQYDAEGNRVPICDEIENVVLQENVNYDFTIEMDNFGFSIKINKTGGEEIFNKKINIPDISRKSFGFFSAHYDHGCEEYGKFSINNIKVQ